MKGILVADFPTRRDKVLSIWQDHLKKVQEIAGIYSELGLPTLKKGELLPLFNDTKGFIYDKMVEAGLSLGNAQIKRDVAIEMVEYPKGFDKLTTALAVLFKDEKYKYLGNDLPTVRADNFRFSNIEKVYEVGENNEVYLEPAFLNEINEIGKYYASTEAAQAAYNFMKDVNDLFYKHGLDKHIKAANPIVEIASAFNKLDYSNQTFTVLQSRFNNGNFTFFQEKK